MQSLDPIVFLAVFQEMSGLFLMDFTSDYYHRYSRPFFALLLRKTIITRRLVISQFIGLFGGVLALILMGNLLLRALPMLAGPIGLVTRWNYLRLRFCGYNNYLVTPSAVISLKAKSESPKA